MKILALGDPHGKLPRGLKGIVKRNKIDLIICVGDWAFTPEKAWLEESWKGVKRKFIDDSYKNTVDEVCSFGLPVLTLRGNMFMTNNKYKADKILRKHKNLINKFVGKHKVKDETFIFFDVVYEKHNARSKRSKKHFESNLSKERRLNLLLKDNENSILITHNPPYGYLDKAYTGKHVGSKIILNAIKRYKPKLVLCGHIHEARGKAKIGKTPVYNLGERGDYAVFEVVGDKVKKLESNFLK